MTLNFFNTNSMKRRVIASIVLVAFFFNTFVLPVILGDMMNRKV